MAFNFDELEQETEFEEEQVDAVVQSLNDFDAEEDEDENLEEDVEARLELAVYFKTLINGALFEGDESRAARFVQKRVRDFAKAELKSLLGMGAPKVVAAAAQFTEEEVAALKIVAARLTGRPSSPPAPVEPQIRKAAPVVQPTAPTLRARAAPAAPPAAPQAPAAARKAPAAPKPAKGPSQTGKKRQPSRKVVDEKIVKNSMGDETDTSSQTIKDENGRLTREYFDKDGNKIGERDMTPQVRPPTSQPMPSDAHMAGITYSQAAATADAQSANLGSLGAPLLNTLMS